MKVDPKYVLSTGSILTFPDLIVTNKRNFRTVYKLVFWPMTVSGKAGLHKNSVSYWSDLHTLHNGTFLASSTVPGGGGGGF